MFTAREQRETPGCQELVLLQPPSL